MRRLSVILLLLLAAVSCRPSENRLLEELDGYVARSDEYQHRKEHQLEALRTLAATTRDPQSQTDLLLQTGEAYFSYKYDSARFYLNRSLDLAADLGDGPRYQSALLRLGHLDAKAGHFVEAYSTLFTQVDTMLLSPEDKADYFYYAYDLCKDLEGNAVSLESLPAPDRLAYRERLYGLFPEDSAPWRTARIDELLEEVRLHDAKAQAMKLAYSVQPYDRNNAMYAYILADIASRRSRSATQLEWLVKSAESDFVNAVKDYASLTIVAQILTGSDIDRAFRYMRKAQEDAVFYNGMLRPWQISQSFNIIQRAYEDARDRLTRLARRASILLAVLVIALLVALRILFKRSRKLAGMQRELQESNRQLELKNDELSGLNREITEAGQIKEAYIGRVLDLMSENVTKMQAYDNHVRLALKQGKAAELLKELSISTRSDDELQAFYQTFDTTFLALYPDFVEQFNALLREEARVYPKKGELLCTELRIFALIRLGIEDSTRIASLLHYSVNTIYNYKVKVKNGALRDRESFEEQVKSIGI
ncbi:MAG: hypothetical protein IJ799_03525 [Bacteroidales bacterium]|nr:hypothetical protein [Bacteroidales bacterium]